MAAGRRMPWFVVLAAVFLSAAPAAGQGILALDNGAIRIGVDTTKGGAIVILQPSGTGGAASNVVNSFDLGREIQQSYYAGPADFQPAGTTQNPNWNPWPWNPVQAGDSYGNGSLVVASSTTGGVLYTKTVPKQWALKNVDSECAIEQWITLSGSVATVRNRLTNARSDTVQYAALDQELPAVYTRATLTTLKTYAGTQPFTGGALTTIPNASPPSWASFRATEGWAAYVNSSDWGLGVCLPGNVSFKGGFYTSGTATGTASPSTGYIAPIRAEIIDHNIVYDYTYQLVLGSLASIRAFALANKPALAPDYQFQATRAGWTYKGSASDTGFPIADHLTVNIDGPDPQMWGPECTFPAADVTTLYVRAAYALATGTSATAQFFWERDNGASPMSEANSKRFTVVNDGQYRIYEVAVSSTATWAGQISRLRFDPASTGTTGDTMDIQFVSSSYPTTVPIDVTSGTQTQIEARNAFLDGSYGVVKTGSGTLVLTSSNGFTGGTTVAAGTLRLAHPLALNASTLNVPSGTAGRLSFGTLTSATVGGLTGSGSLALVNAAAPAAAVALTVGGNGQSTAFAGVLSGSGAFTKTGTGTLTLTGTASTLDGPLTVNRGRLVIDPGATGTFAVGGKLTLAAGSGAAAALEIVSGSVGLTAAGIAAIGDSSGTSSFIVTGGTTTLAVSTGRLLVGNKGIGSLSVADGRLALTGTNDIVIGGDAFFAQSNAAGTVTVTAGTLSIPGTGVLRMGVNVSGTTVGARGTVNLVGGVFETARAFTVGTGTGIIGFDGGTLRFLTSSTAAIAVTTTRIGPGGAIFDTAGNSVTVAQPLLSSGSGSGGLTKLGAGTLRLSGSNTFTGPTSVITGTLAIALRAALDRSATIDVGAVLDVSSLPAGFDVSSGQTLRGSGTVVGSVTFGRGSTLSPGTLGNTPSLGLAAASLAAAGDRYGPLEVLVVPEPASVWMVGLGLGIIWLGTARRRSVRTPMHPPPPATVADDLPVRLEGVVKRYGRRTVLDHVTCAVRPGITGLVGPNGAGKSTLVRAILGLVRLASGTARVFGIDSAREPRRARRLVGVVPEDECTVPGLRAVEMVRYAARLSGLPGTEALRRAHEVLDWCDAGQERYRAVETLSVGMRQKVAFAAAIVHDPALVILDEPTNGLDPLERQAMLGRLTTLAHDHGKTVLMSTHVLPDVQAICDRVIVLAGGRVRLAGTIDDLTRPVVPHLRLEAAGPLDACAALLRDRGLEATCAADGAILVADRDAAAVDCVWRAARETGLAVRSLAPARLRFEEVFLEAIDEGQHAAP